MYCYCISCILCQILVLAILRGNMKRDNFYLQTTFCEQLAGAGQGAGHSRKLGVVRSRVVATYIIPQVD